MVVVTSELFCLTKFQEKLKNNQVFQKIAKGSDIKNLKTIPSQIKFFQLPIIKPSRWFSGPCVWKDVNIEK